MCYFGDTLFKEDEMMKNAVFSQNLKMLRTERKETQENLAEKLYVDKTAISHWENGRRTPNAEMQEMIAKYFGVTREELVGISDESVEITKIPGCEIFCFPQIDFEKKPAFKLYKEALEIDKCIALGKGNQEDVPSMFIKYTEAFYQGMLEAGVNLLKQFFILEMNIKNKGEEILTFDDLIQEIIHDLQEANNPAGDYYEAIWLMENLVHNGKDKDVNFESGLILLYELANEGNPYAVETVEHIELADEVD